VDKTTTKVCAACGEGKPLSEYSKQAAHKDGLRYACKACVAIKTRAYREANSEKIAAYQRKYKAENKKELAAYNRKYDHTYRAENKAKIAARGREYRSENKAKIAAYWRGYRVANGEGLKAISRAWQIANKESATAYGKAHKKAHPEVAAKARHKRRALKLGNGTFEVTAKDLLRIRNSPCVHCGAPGPSHVDHVIPLSKGGTHSIGNLMPLCQTCNSSKRANYYSVFRYHTSQ